MKRFIADCVGNYIFFVPLVILLTAPLRSVEGAETYMVSAIPITIIGARTYTWFLKRWYRLWHVEF